jgi:hypothetical protein
MKAGLMILISALGLSFSKPPAVVDYRKVFGNDYTWAVNWLKQNDQLIARYAVKYNVPVKELKAIVFPELVRYNRVFDALEIESLKFLYVSEGKDYANFSVGFFQMKPSFAEMIEMDADKVFGYARLSDDENSRKARVRRLTSIEQQMVYLCAFYRICDRKFSSFKFSSPAQKLKFFATAYNSGYHLKASSLEAMQSRNHFNGYNYADVSLFYFQNK